VQSIVHWQNRKKYFCIAEKVLQKVGLFFRLLIVGAPDGNKDE
jgi:hypothetical protein